MLNVFVAVGETRCFAAAAHRLGLSPAAVTRSIANLEMMLGVELLQRTTRNVRLTEAGQRYLDNVRNVVAEIDEVMDSATAIPKGQLVIAAPESFGKSFVMPCIVEYLARFPHVEVVATFLDRVTDLAQAGAHVAIGIGHLRDPSLFSTRVGYVWHVLCASPAYLERYGAPQHPTDLLGHAVVGLNAAGQSTLWRFEGEHGEFKMPLRARLTVTTVEAAIEAAELGLGVVRLFSYQAGRLVAEGRLRVVLNQYRERPRPVYVLSRERYRDVSKVSQFVQMMVRRLGNEARLQSPSA